MVELVRIKDKFQVTIPVQVRRALNMQAGEYLQVVTCADGVLYRKVSTASSVPVSNPTDTQRKLSIVDFLRQQHANRSREEIDHEIQQQRDSWTL